jgi:hypothetical protein
MPPLFELQEQFTAALRDPALPAPAPLRGHGEARPEKRFAVYRNNVYVSLVEAVRASYGVIERLVGKEFFHAMARAYVGENLPCSPVLLEYGADFPAFIERFEPAATLPYLADVARLEWAWQEAYHAADAEPLSPAALASVAAPALGGLILQLHPTLRLLRSPWPVFSIWQTNRHDEQVRSIALDAGGEDVAVMRPGLEVDAQTLPAGVYPFLARLAQGALLEQAVAAAQQERADLDLVAALSWLLTSGAIVGFRPASIS